MLLMHQVHVSDNVSALLLNGVGMFTGSSREQNMSTGNVIVSLSDVGMVVHDNEYKCKSYHFSFTDAPCTKYTVEF